MTTPEDLKEPPVTVTPIHVPPDQQNRPPRMELLEKSRMRAAAHRAKTIYPGPVGELISRELLSFEEFGYVLSNGGLVVRLVEHVMTAPRPGA